MKCRFCSAPLEDVFLDLGSAPPSNAFLTADELNTPETWFPLRLFTCRQCHLVQVDEIQQHDKLFASDYVYFSGYSSTWLQHCRQYVDNACQRLELDADKQVVEIASNDGSLLQYVKQRGIPCVGIEPTAGTAAAARERGIDTIEQFFGRAVAQQFVTDRGHADLVIANNVLAHVPDINDFVAGLATLLAAQGVATLEFPHLMQLIDKHQFDTIYHEHFSYFSLHTAQAIFAAHGLRIWDVEELPTHGGSLRLWACAAGAERQQTAAVTELLERETSAGMQSMDYYRHFQAVADTVKNDFLAFLLQCKRDGKQVAAYGAAAKGNTLLNYAGIRPDLLPWVADASPHKQGRYLPGSRIPVVAETRIHDTRPDCVIILPWNLHSEIMQQLDYIRDWDGKFVTAVPQLAVA